MAQMRNQWKKLSLLLAAMLMVVLLVQGPVCVANASET